jgi:hypothetical protein
MIESRNKSEIVYSICVEDIQNEAQMHIKRELDDEELERAIKLIDYGIGESMFPIYGAIFDEINTK